MKRIHLLFCINFLIFFAACKKNSPDPSDLPPQNYTPDNSFKIVAYFPSYRDPEAINTTKYKMLTHLFYAFLNPNADGSLAALEQPGRFNTVMQRAKANGLKAGISISGTRSIFISMAASATSRSLFVKNVTAFARNNKLDGVDLDWEYPSTADGSADHYVLLVKELSDSLHKHNKFLSAAITPGVYAGSIRDGLKSDVFPLIDFFNIMVYDGIGWDKNEPYQHASYDMAVSSLNYWINTRGMPKQKAVLGIPAYGKNASNSALAFRDIVNSGADYTMDAALIGSTMYYFNGTSTTRKKAKLAKDGANGLMFWELYQDDNAAKSMIKAANDELGRSYN